jgi:hypothetical protein
MSSAVGLKRKGAEQKVEQRTVMEDVEDKLVASLELSNGVMEQVEVMAKELGNINQGMWALVAGIRKLTEVVEESGKEVTKVDKETEMEEVQKVDKQMETEEKDEDSEKEEESEEEKEEEDKEEEKDGRKKDDEEDEEESDGTEDREEGEVK